MKLSVGNLVRFECRLFCEIEVLLFFSVVKMCKFRVIVEFERIYIYIYIQWNLSTNPPN